MRGIEEAGKELKKYLREMGVKKASDLFLKVGALPYFRIDGIIQPWGEKKLTASDTELMAHSLMSEKQWEYFEQRWELDMACHLDEMQRFRVNVFRQRGTVGLVFRFVQTKIPSFEELNLPVDVLRRLSLEPRGLVLITGTAGSGKSTTSAAMVDYINSQRRAHIVTIEDPIEFLHLDKMGIVNQREVEIDTSSFTDALRHVIRQSPDVIQIGEMRDLETISAAISAAETGHLVISTLHTIDATQTIERIINYFPPYQHPEVRMQLSFLLKGVVSMRLLSLAGGSGRIPAVAVMLSSPTIRKLILEGKTSELYGVIENSNIFGMCTFNQALVDLHKNGLITLEEALEASDSPDDFKLKIKGISTGPESVVTHE